MTDHVHTAACVGVNELDELCCRDLAGTHLRDAVTYSIRVRADDHVGTRYHTVRVFTDDGRDARRIIEATGYRPAGAAKRLVRQPADPYA